MEFQERAVRFWESYRNQSTLETNFCTVLKGWSLSAITDKIFPTARGESGHDDFIAVSIQFEYDPDDLATKITTQLVHKSNSKTYV